MSSNDEAGDEALGPTHSTAALFRVVWDTISELIGSAATATLVRRAAKRASLRAPVLSDLRVERSDFVYHFSLPENGPFDDTALRDLAIELRSLLLELTGPVVLKRLGNHPQVKHSLLFREPDEP